MRYDLAVVGGGPAGYSAALEASELGMNVIIFENSFLGGTCLNRGCVPTKFLLHTAELFYALDLYEKYGINVSKKSLDFVKTQTENYIIVEKQRKSLQNMLEAHRIRIIGAEAHIIDKFHIKADGESYETERILIATGSVPVKPFVPNAVTSDRILKEQTVPKMLTIIGGGVVAVEFAWLFNLLGSDVTIKIRGDRILRKWDKELAVGIQQSMKKKNIKIITKCSEEDMCTDNSGLILFAAGRVPNVPDFGGVDIKTGDDGGILVDEFGRTNIDGIYAAGDVISGSSQLAHIAMEQGKRSVRHMANIECGPQAADVSCIYLSPEIASIGMTEEKAKLCGISAVSAKQPMSGNVRTAVANTERSFIKLVADQETGKIIGAQLMCERACDIAAELSLAINNGITVKRLRDSIRPHPSFCEAVTEAAALLCKKLKESDEIGI